MTPPDDRESNSGGKEPWLPPRLRDKLDTKGGGSSDDDFDFLKKKGPPIELIVIVIVVVGIVGGLGFLVMKSREAKKKEEIAAAQQAAAERAKAVADSLAAVAQADSIKAAAVADSIALSKMPKWKRNQVLAERAKKAGGAAPASTPGAPAGGAVPKAGGAAAGGAAGGGAAAGGAAAGGAAGGSAGGAPAAPAEPAAPKEKGPYGIDAGQYLDEAKANSVADDLKTKTGLAAKVVNVSDTFHVLLGSFSSRASADAKANALLGKGLIEQGGVMPLTPPQ